MNGDGQGDGSSQNRPLLPDLVLHQICKFLNISELKSFRIVCSQWYDASLTHVQNRGCLQLNSEFQNFQRYADSTSEHCPVRNLKLSIYPKSFGCKCGPCNNTNPVPQFNESSLEKIIGKSTSGIKFFELEKGRRHMSKNVHFTEFRHHNFNIDVERLLLREEFQMLRELRIVAPFELTKDSGINSVFRKLTHLYMSHECRKNEFAENVLKQCSGLRSLTIGWDDVMGSEAVHELDITTFAGGILDALTNAKKENQFNCLEEIKIDARFFAVNYLLDPQIHLIKIHDLDLNLTALHIPMIIIYEPDTTLIHAIQDILESRKDFLLSLTLPHFWVKIELENFPQMKSLKEFVTSVNLKLPMMELHHKVPVLKSLHFTDGMSEGVGDMYGNELNGFSDIENVLSQNIIPCKNVSELHLDFVHNVEVLVGLSKIFPNIQILNVDLKSEDLHKLWTTWPRLQELTLMVQYDYNDAPMLEQIAHGFVAQTPLDPSKFHAGLIGMTVDQTEALIESSVPFLSLNKKHYDLSLPSIRDLQGLKKLTLKSGGISNVGLMLGVLPMKNLIEVEMTSSDITIDCVQHILKSSPKITRWSFGGYGYNDSHDTETRLNSKIVDWKISSKCYSKVEPAFKKSEVWSQSSVVAELCKNYGRGKCLFTTPYQVSPPPSDNAE